jgi:dTDP-4-amino-4,6-dideoxygalactose transaminase
VIRLSKSSVGAAEKAAVAKVLDREFFGMGAEVAAFEAELEAFFGRPAACVVNGTAALHLALQGCGIGPGDEVLVQSLTYVASFQAISATGARPVSCDVERSSLTLDWRDAQRRITSRTKAIMPVHYAGGTGNLEGIHALAREHGLRVIEDAAHAFGCSFAGRRIGSFGDIACFSFDGIKNITSGEGGCVVTADAEVMARVRDSRLLGVMGDSDKRKAGERTWAPAVERQGWRYHMSDIMAAIGRVQLGRLPEFAEKRRRLVAHYRRRLGPVRGIEMLDYDLDDVIPFIFAIRVMPPADREVVRERLKDAGIPTGVHYYPNHQLAYFRPAMAEPLPCTEAVAGQVLTLPLHFDLSEQDVDLVCGHLETALMADGGVVA